MKFIPNTTSCIKSSNTCTLINNISSFITRSVIIPKCFTFLPFAAVIFEVLFSKISFGFSKLLFSLTKIADTSAHESSKHLAGELKINKSIFLFSFSFMLLSCNKIIFPLESLFGSPPCNRVTLRKFYVIFFCFPDFFFQSCPC